MATRKKKATAKSLPQSNSIPDGMKQIGAGYADTWIPEVGDSIHGPTTSEVKTVELKIGRRTNERRCVEVTDQNSGERVTVWESAALAELFDELAGAPVGTVVYIYFKGLGTAKKAGQNPPKLFDAAIAA